MDSKIVLVTGSNGLLGQKITDLYLQHPEKQLIATGKGPNRHPAAGKFTYAEMDITDEKQVMQVVMKYRPACIIHTAAMTNVDACEQDRESCVKQNIDAVRYIIAAAKAVGAQLVHVSTDFIFNGEDGPYDENATPDPLSYYGWSKWEGEKLVQASGLNWSILRTVLVYGVVNDMSRSNIVLWAKKALEGGQPMKVVNDQFRTPTLAEDLAMGCFLAEDKQAQGIYNISGKDQMGVYELVKRVAAFYGLDASEMETVSSATLNQPARRPPITGFIIDKARRDLGYNPHSFEEGLALVKQQLEEFSKQ